MHVFGSTHADERLGSEATVYEVEPRSQLPRTTANGGVRRVGKVEIGRLEIDQGELARISAAADDEVLRCPECGAILLRVKDGGR